MPTAEKRREALALLEARAWDRARETLVQFLQSGEPGAAEDAGAWYGLSRAYLGLGQETECESALLRAYNLTPKNPEIAGAAATRLTSAGAYDQAVAVLKRALFASPDDIGLLAQLADTYEAAKRYTAALKACARLAHLLPNDAGPRLKAGRIRTIGTDYAGAEAEFRAAASLEPKNVMALDNLATILRATGRVEEAREVLLLRAAVGGDPSASAAARLMAAMTQPVVPRSEAEIEESRARLVEALARGPEAPIADPFRAGLGPIFFANYQAKDDRALHEAFAAYYRAATPSLEIIAPHVGNRPKGRRLRVGILTAYFADQTVGYLTYGLAVSLDRALFDLVLLRPSHALADGQTERFRAAARVVDLPRDLSAARAAIAAEKLDILHFPEIGMDHFTYFIAFARLATLQTMAWGHPLTSGLPHIDLFLSVDAMEPPDGEDHYRERLIRCKGLTFAAERVPQTTVNRAAAGLGPGPAYVCLQSLCKVHPRFDDIVARILREDRAGIAYFISSGAYADSLLRDRLAKCVGEGISRVRFMPRMQRPEFLNLAGAADVALDVPEWSGGKTSLETFAMGTPIVHMPGEFMRGRHTLAFYRRMGIGSALAQSPDHYADTAIRLANDGPFRSEVRAQIKEAHSSLFEDWASIQEIAEIWTAELAART